MAITYTGPTNSPTYIQGSVTAQDDAIALLRFKTTGGIAIQITGTWTGAVTFEATVDGSTWVTLNVTPSASGTDVSTATANGAWSKAINGYAGIRARFSTAGSGTPVVTIRATNMQVG